jgi:hypothetical protein
VVFFLAGCGKKGTISGTVTYKNKPLPSGTVSFICDKVVRSSSINPDGTYTVKDVPAGEAKVTVIVGAAAQPIKVGKGDPAQMIGAKDKSKVVSVESAEIVQIPPEYADPDKSKLTCTVAGGDQKYDIPLK